MTCTRPCAPCVHFPFVFHPTHIPPSNYCHSFHLTLLSSRSHSQRHPHLLPTPCQQTTTTAQFDRRRRHSPCRSTPSSLRSSSRSTAPAHTSTYGTTPSPSGCASRPPKTIPQALSLRPPHVYAWTHMTRSTSSPSPYLRARDSQ
ncbi:hypothetical protein F5148DRAFT_1376407 [Russula earlei]|uniref:Uncharacterized protein n=1 Tax=Russula earlei TaxID=71964 RepID=A0ACC0U7F4_9AGAM|nr:hypothetical protein F5148DRAFT_1376407 [Russula earlei]